jgi:hypothetical protein
MSTTLLDTTSFKNFFQYSFNEQSLNSFSKEVLSEQAIPLSTILYSNKPGGSIGYKNYKSVTSLLENNRSSSLNTLTDKQNFTNSLKFVDTTKKVLYGNNLTSSYYDEFVSTNQNNFFS